jgi:hypothetical protein
MKTAALRTWRWCSHATLNRTHFSLVRMRGNHFIEHKVSFVEMRETMKGAEDVRVLSGENYSLIKSREAFRKKSVIRVY